MTAKSTTDSEADFLTNYDPSAYPSALLTVDLAIFTLRDGCLRLLLIKRDAHPEKGKLALPGGFVDLVRDANLQATASRKLFEKTGVSLSHLEQVHTQGNRDRDPRGWSITVLYMALVSDAQLEAQQTENSADLHWRDPAALTRSRSLAFDHRDLIKVALTRLRAKAEYTSLPLFFMPEAFTLSELQQSFEILLGKKLEKKSFRRRILDANVVEETGEMKRGHARPAKLYKASTAIDAHHFSRNLEGPRS